MYRSVRHLMSSFNTGHYWFDTKSSNEPGTGHPSLSRRGPIPLISKFLYEWPKRHSGSHLLFTVSPHRRPSVSYHKCLRLENPVPRSPISSIRKVPDTNSDPYFCRFPSPFSLGFRVLPTGRGLLLWEGWVGSRVETVSVPDFRLRGPRRRIMIL